MQLRSVAMAVLALSWFGCSGSMSGGGNQVPAAIEKKVDAKSGGAVTITDGSQVSIPPGALAQDTTITIQPSSTGLQPSSTNPVGLYLTLGPEGQQFSTPVTITVAFDPAKLPVGMTANDIVIYTAPKGSSNYTALDTHVVDSTHVAAAVSHFSTFVAVLESAPPSSGSDGGSGGGNTSQDAGVGTGNSDAGTVVDAGSGSGDRDAGTGTGGGQGDGGGNGGGGGSGTRDGGASSDAGTGTGNDAGTATDGGSGGGGGSTPDAGSGKDAGSSDDAGSGSGGTDAGSGGTDAGSGGADAGSGGTDAGSGSADAGSGGAQDGGSAPVALGGIKTFHFFNAQTETVVPKDLSGFGPEAWALNAGNWEHRTGTGDTQGHFQISDVASLPAWISVDFNRWVYTSDVQNNLSSYALGRTSQPSSSAGTTLTITADSMTAWQAGDDIELTASGAGIAGQSLNAFNNNLADGGDTSFSYAVPFHQINGTWVDANQGDVVYVTHVGPLNSKGSLSARGLVDFLSSDTVAMTDGANTNLTGTFQSSGHDLQASFTLPSTTYAQLAPDVMPGAQASGVFFTLLAQPETLAHGQFSNSATLLSVGAPADAADQAFTYFVQNPFPASWGVLGETTVTYSTSISVPGFASPINLYSLFVAQRSLPGLVSDGLGPVVGPIRAPLIDGADAFVGHPSVGAHPTFSWTVPLVGKPNFYELELLQVDGSQSTVSRQNFHIPGTQTSFTVPGAFLVSGNTYVLRISAYVSNDPFSLSTGSYGLPYGRADVLTSYFSP